MSDTSQFRIGAEANCSDGPAGQLSRVIVDPAAEKVTHLVVEPGHRRDLGRLVPLDLVESVAGAIRLRCTKAQFDQLDHALETHLNPASSDYQAYGYGPDQVGYFGLGGGQDAGSTPAEMVSSDTVPPGEVDVRSGDPVHATDGDIGRVEGIVIDPRSGHVTHVLLQEGHLWGRKQVAIPISAVASTTGGIRLTIAKHEVQALPPLNTDQEG